MRNRSGTVRAALLGIGITWFGTAVFLLGLAGEHVNALMSGSWPRAAGLVIVFVAGVGPVAAGTAANSRIPARRRRTG